MNSFYINSKGETVFKAKCNYPGCGKWATKVIHLVLTLTQPWIGGRVAMGLEVFSCKDHIDAVERFTDLVGK